MKRQSIITLISVMIFTSKLSYGQGQDFLRSVGKIYSVVGVIAIIFVGLAFYLYRLDRKLTKLENQINHEQ